MSQTTQFDIAIVGGGIIGLAHAWIAAKRGLSVVLFERNQTASGASVRNFGAVWPIGMTSDIIPLALRSREIWLDVIDELNIWHEKSGSLHVAHHELEEALIHEFLQRRSNRLDKCCWLSAAEAIARSPHIYRPHLRGALWSPYELNIDAPSTIQAMTKALKTHPNVKFESGVLVTHLDNQSLETTRGVYTATRTIVCGGMETQSLFPTQIAELNLRRCKLQMLSASPPKDTLKLGPTLVGGLSLRHHSSFAQCPSQTKWKEHVHSTMPEYDQFGIHVMVSQNQNCELIIGDSHQYDPDITIYEEARIEFLILEYLGDFFRHKELKINRRWSGYYLKHPTQTFARLQPLSNTTIVLPTGGVGMTLSFGLAEETLNALNL